MHLIVSQGKNLKQDLKKKKFDPKLKFANEKKKDGIFK